MDAWLPGADAAVLAGRLHQTSPATHLMLVTRPDDRLPSISPEHVTVVAASDLPLALRRLGSATRSVAGARSVAPALSSRELEVLKLMATDRSYREIAEHLSLGEETVRTHSKSILRKLAQPDRAQAVIAAARIGLLQLI